MTEPLVPRKLVWAYCNSGDFNYAIVDIGGIPHTYRIDHKPDYGWLVSWNCDSLTERVGTCFLDEAAAQAAAQQHYNELATACCEVKRCVCEGRKEIGVWELGQGGLFGFWSPEIPAYCPKCGGSNRVEGGE